MRGQPIKPELSETFASGTGQGSLQYELPEQLAQAATSLYRTPAVGPLVTCGPRIYLDA